MKVIDGTETFDLGVTETAPTISLIDYSRRVTDNFGVTTVVRRGFARRLSVRMQVPFDQTSTLQRRLADLRATPALWVADDRSAWLSAQGIFKDFEIDHATPPVAYCTLSVEGLAETETVADAGGDPAPDGQTSTLRLLKPVAVTDGMLIASSVPEADFPDWSGAIAYAAGNKVIVRSSHRIYESLIGANAGHDPVASPGQWLDVGPTNRWAMFDQALGTTTTANDALSATFASSGIRAVALLDAAATTARVEIVVAGDVVYDQSKPAGPGTVTFLDLPATDGQITVTVSGTGPIAVGTMLVGQLLGLGITEASPTAGITDYSRKEVDDFGEVTIVERAWSKKMAAKALIATNAIDIVANRIADIRATPALWIGNGIDSLTVYGFFKDFSIEVGENVSKLSLSIEGLSTAAPVVVGLPATSVPWTGVTNPDPINHPKPDDGAVNTRNPDAPLGPSGATVATTLARILATEQEIDELANTYGDTASAAASASAALAAKNAAQDAQGAAETARGQAQSAYAAADSARAAALESRNLASGFASNASGSADAAAGSASIATTKATEAGQSASSASGSANIAAVHAGYAQDFAGQSAGSASASAASASSAAGSSTASGLSASAAQTAEVAARLSVAHTLPSGFSPAEHKFWAPTETAEPANTVPYDDSWFGPVSYPAFATRAGQQGLVAAVGNFVPVVGHTYKTSLSFARVVEGAGPSFGAIALAIKELDGSITYEGSYYGDLGSLGYGVVVTWGSEWVCNRQVAWIRPRFHWNYPGDSTTAPSSHIYHLWSFGVDDITAQKAAEAAASASASSASSAAASQTAAGNSASAANVSATNAATSATQANDQAYAAYLQNVAAAGYAGTASTKASEASISASNASGSASLAGTYAGQAASARDTAGGSASAAASSASVAQAASDSAGSNSSAAQTSATQAYGHAVAAGVHAGTAADQAYAAYLQNVSAGTYASTSQSAASAASASASAAQSAANLSASYSRPRPNLVVNGSGENGLNGIGGNTFGWYTGTGIWGPVFETASINSVSDALVWPQFSVQPGATYTVSADAALFASGGIVWVDIAWINSAGAVFDYSAAQPRGASFYYSADMSGKDQIAVAVVAPPGALRGAARFVWNNISGLTVMGLRQMKVELGGLPWTGYDQSLAPAYAALSSKASIDQVNSVAASAESARAATQSTLQSSINGLSSQVSIQAGTLSDISGKTAYYFQVIGTTPQGQQRVALTSVGGGTFIVDAPTAIFSGNVIIGGTLNGRALESQTVSLGGSTSASDNLGGQGINNPQSYLDYSFSLDRPATIYAVATVKQSSTDGAKPWNGSLNLDGDWMQGALTGGGGAITDSWTVSGSARAGAGTHTVHLMWATNAGNSVQIGNRTLFVIVIKDTGP